MDRIPILKVGPFLLVTIQVDMHDRLAMTLQDDLTQKIVDSKAKGVMIDISALDMVDSFIGRMIAHIASLSRLLDAETVVVGMQPAVAITLVELGMTLSGVKTALDVDRGMAWLNQNVSLNREEDEPESHSADEDEGGRANSQIETLPLVIESDVVIVRQTVRKWCVAMRFSLTDQTKMVTAASEIARNTLVYGRGGTASLEEVSDGDRQGLRLIFTDKGPGIEDIERALSDGFTSGQGLGLGLGGSRRLVHEFDIQSKPGEGTRVSLLRWNR